jgi:hypothetical protein
MKTGTPIRQSAQLRLHAPMVQLPRHALAITARHQVSFAQLPFPVTFI